MNDNNPVTIAQGILDRTNELRRLRKVLDGYAKRKADALAAYDKRLAITILALKNGKSFTLEGQFVKDPAVSITERIAKGICWREQLEKTKTEGQYKMAIVEIDALQAELNGMQSIYRHLDSV